MKLIDADNLQKYDWGHLKEVSKEALFLIETEPTVEAIPVEFIEQKMKEYKFIFNNSTHRVKESYWNDYTALKRLLSAWNTERGSYENS